MKKRFRLHYLILGFVCVLSGPSRPIKAETQPLPQREHARRALVVQKQLLGMLPEVEQRLKTAPDSVEVREATNIAMLLLTAGRNTEAERYLRMGFDTQNMKPGDAYGSLPWNVGNQDIQDANAIDFGTQSLGPILLEHEHDLSPALLAYLRPHAQASLVALQRHVIPVSYTNIFLMNTMNTILISEWLHDGAQAQRGYSQLKRWMDYTRQNGVHEFDSPTYTAVDLASLLLGYRYSVRPEVHAMCKAALDFFWTDLVANYLPVAQRLVGAHSRDYYFLYGIGDMDPNYFVEGFRDDPGFSRSPFEKVFLVDSAMSPLGYEISKPLLAVPANRIVTERWDADPARTRYTLLTPDFALGTANGDYGPQDKMFAMDFAPRGGKQLATVSLVATADGKPYGIDLAKDQSGHPKPNHLKSHFAAVQKDGMALAVMALTPSEAKGGPFYFDVLMPSEAEISLNREVASHTSAFTRSTGKDDVVGVRSGDACFAIRAWTPDGEAVTGTLQADDGGLKLGALRFTVSTSPAASGETSRIAYLAVAEHCSGKANSAVERLTAVHLQSQTAGMAWSLSAVIAGSKLELVYDLTALKSSSRKVDGVDVTTTPLQITPLRTTATRVVPLPDPVIPSPSH